MRMVPAHHLTDTGFKLGAWQTSQRAAYRLSRLSDERIARLEARLTTPNPFVSPPPPQYCASGGI